MNVHELDRPLVMGDQAQMAVLRKLKEGWVACVACGKLIEVDDAEKDAGLCWGCFVGRSCQECGELLTAPEDIDERMCDFCRDEAL